GDFRKLPASGVGARFGEETVALHDFLRGKTWTPLCARLPVRPVQASVAVEPPDDDRTRLLFALKGALHELTRELREKSEGIQVLEIRLELDHAPPHTERIETAAATRDVTRLIDLVRLRLGATELAAPVETIRIEVGARAMRPRQTDLLETPPRRDREAAAATIARVKAAYGTASVVRAELVDSHLPESRVRWVPLAEVPEPHPPRSPEGPLPLVRSLRAHPVPLPDPPRHERERWLGRHGAVVRMFGPDRRGDGWWDQVRDRDYFYVETKTGAVLWLYQNRESRGWYLHGAVE
ncbi:MAG: hypothetical protein HKN12_02485, partial [Gemmatimonadetes bacterium]|nr:hypothetical protein [Gemmatimonadota bacterium]